MGFFLNGLKDLKGFKGFKFLYSQLSIIKQTPPPFGHPLLGGAAERNFDHPSQPPLS